MSSNPLVSFFLFSYNQENFIQEALTNAFSQTYQPLEIIVSDDSSTDRTFEIIEKMADEYNGPHNIILNRNEVNLGLANNINRAFEIANGLFFVMSAGDDISIPERTELLVKRWQDKSSPVDLVCSHFQEIDINSNPTGLTCTEVIFLPDLNQHVSQWECAATGAVCAWSRKLYDKYGPLDPEVIAEDWIFPFRAWMESGMDCVEAPLVKRRNHDASISVIHRNIKKSNDENFRRSIMEKATRGKLARAKEWRKAWDAKCKNKQDKVSIQLQQWIELLKLECSGFHTDRLTAFKHALISLFKHRCSKTAARIFVRHVLKRY